MDFDILMDHRVKIKESKKIDKYLDLAREKKAVKHEGDVDINCIWCTWNGCKRFGKKTGVTRNQRANWDHPNYSIVEIG